MRILLCFYFFGLPIFLPSIFTKNLSQYHFLIYPTQDTSFSLDDQDYNFIILPNKENTRILFKARFPIKSFFEIDSLSPYIFVPEIFCLDCLSKENLKIKTLKGNIYRGQFEDIKDAQLFLSNIVVEITEVCYYETLTSTPIDKDMYVALSNTTLTSDKSKSVLVMKKNSADGKDFFQVAKLNFYFQDKQSSFDFSIGYEFKIVNGDKPLENGGNYSTTIVGQYIIIIFNNVKSLYYQSTTNYN